MISCFCCLAAAAQIRLTRPGFVAADLATERQIYQTLRAATNGGSGPPITVVSVGHRLDSLLPHHTHVLSFENAEATEAAAGEWRLRTTSEFSASQEGP